MFNFLKRAWTSLTGRGDEEFIYMPDEDEKSSSGGGAARGSMMVGGAVSKGDGDARMTKKQQNKVMRSASVKVRAMDDGGDAMDKARSGVYATLQSEIKNMDGLALYNFLTSNPSHMSQTGDPHVQRKMINDGYAKQLDVLAHGTYEAAQRTGRKEVMNALMIKPMSEMSPSEQSYVWDKLSELGEVSGSFDGNVEALESAVVGFVMSSAAGEQMVQAGQLSLEGQRSAAPAAKEEQKRPQQVGWEAPKPK